MIVDIEKDMDKITGHEKIFYEDQKGHWRMPY